MLKPGKIIAFLGKTGTFVMLYVQNVHCFIRDERVHSFQILHPERYRTFLQPLSCLQTRLSLAQRRVR